MTESTTAGLDAAARPEADAAAAVAAAADSTSKGGRPAMFEICTAEDENTGSELRHHRNRLGNGQRSEELAA